jgi:alkanesulfonate monooxygenase SsuD/methylene tetrahydromethanopterin reductase-like flavin-dependent oxidoreductase (luciferase family)
VVVTHTEPFHAAKAIATLDYASIGRAGLRVRVSASPEEAAHVGRRDPLPAGDLPAEAADDVEVVRRLWDSWEDGAEIRDVATGRFVDRDRLHYIDFTGRFFSVKGPSITPRPPQGQPVVAALGHGPGPYRLIAGSADVGFVTPRDAGHARDIVAGIGSAPESLLFADLVVFLGATAGAEWQRRGAL